MADMSFCCHICGRHFVFPEDVALQTCPACGTLHPRPHSVGASLDTLKRAHFQRAACDFVHAEESYAHVLRNHPDEHEALWGLVLCKYGVEFIEDSRTHERLPVVHFLRPRPITEDPDFQQACDLAPEAICTQYQAHAAYIANIQRNALSTGTKKSAFDIFLCYKATTPDGKGLAREYKHAADLYQTLTRRGYRVFFAHETLTHAAGANYEAQIFHALHTARVMLVVCSEPEHLQSPWVHSEWSRYLERVDTGEGCHLIPLLYDGCDPYALPEAFTARGLQALDMSPLNARELLLTNLKSTLKSAPRQKKPRPRKPAAQKAKPAQKVKVRKPKPERPKRKKLDRKVLKRILVAVMALMFTAAVLLFVYIDDIRGFHFSRVASASSIPEFDQLPGDSYYLDYYTGLGGVITIPKRHGFQRVTAIGPRAFTAFGARVNHVTIPEGVAIIADDAFTLCDNLTSVSIPNTVTYIGSHAFSECSNLTSVSIPRSVTYIGGAAFSKCSNLTSISIPDSVAFIDNATFLDCSSLASIFIPDSVTYIGTGAFKGCTSLTSVYIPDSVTSIGGEAFYGCTSLTSIYIPDSVTSIGSSPNESPVILGGTFGNCTSLTNISIPDSVTHIGRRAFEGCTSLTSITIPNSVTSLEFMLFANCTNLNNITIPDSVTFIDNGVFDNCPNLTAIVAPDSYAQQYMEEHGIPYTVDPALISN